MIRDPMPDAPWPVPSPYAPPRADLGTPALPAVSTVAEAEAIRRQFLSYEASIRAVGSVYCLLGLLGSAGGAFLLFGPVAEGLAGGGSRSGSPVELGACLGSSGLALALGLGLRLLRPWGRRALGLLSGMATLAYIAVVLQDGGGPDGPWVALPAAGIPAALAAMMLSGDAARVTEPAYRDVIARTPQIRAGILTGALAALASASLPLIGLLAYANLRG